MKLKLSELKVQSFVTSLLEEQKKTVNGAGTDEVVCWEAPTIANPSTGYPCNPCGGGGDTNYCTNNYCTRDGCPTNGGCGATSTCSGLSTGYPCSVAGCYC